MQNYEETKRGFRIVPKSDFDFRQIRGDIARSTCPDCREERGHPSDPSVRMNLKTGLGKCFHCGRNTSCVRTCAPTTVVRFHSTRTITSCRNVTT